MTDVAAFERQLISSLSGKIRERLRKANEAQLDVATLGDPEQLAEAMAAVLPVGHVYDEICGPFYDTAGLTSWLGISRQALHQKLGRHQILACPLADGGSVYPAWQFLISGATIPSLADILSALATGTDDPWMTALWMRAPNPDLDGDRPSEWLRRGGDPEHVRQAARSAAAGWRS